jgi:hypothetical protein
MGFNVIELVGIISFVAVMLLIVGPDNIFKLFDKKNKVKKIKKSKVCDDLPFQSFAYNLMQVDKKHEMIPYFSMVIDIGTKQDKLVLTERFLNYYGDLTIKFLKSFDDLEKHNIADTKSISKALTDIQEICKKFTYKLVENDLMDLQADISVLGVISESDGLKQNQM